MQTTNPRRNTNAQATNAQDDKNTTYLYFIYNVPIGAVAAGAGTSVSSPLQIQADSEFSWEKATFYAFPTGFTENAFNDTLIPELTVNIQDTGSGRYYMNNPVPVSAIFGTGKLPYILPFPQRFLPNALINFTVANLSAAQAYTNVSLNLIGRKIYRNAPA
jgi:hypothetical protein